MEEESIECPEPLSWDSTEESEKLNSGVPAITEKGLSSSVNTANTEEGISSFGNTANTEQEYYTLQSDPRNTFESSTRFENITNLISQVTHELQAFEFEFQTRKEAEKQAEVFRIEISNLKTNNDTFSTEITKLNNEISNSRQETKKLEKNNDKLNGDINELHLTIEDLKKRNEILESNNKKLNDTDKELNVYSQTNPESLKHEDDLNVQSLLQDIDTSRCQLTIKNKQLHGQIDVKKGRIDKMREEVRNRKCELIKEENRMKIVSSLQEYDELESTVKELEEELKMYETEEKQWKSEMLEVWKRLPYFKDFPDWWYNHMDIL